MAATRTPKPPVIICRASRALAQRAAEMRQRWKLTTSETEQLAKIQAELEEMNTARAPAIVAALDAVNGRADAFTVSSWGDLSILAGKAEDELERKGVTQKNRTGAQLTYTPAGPTANSYKRGAISTRVTLRRTSAGAWTLAQVERTTVWPKNPERRTLTVSPAAREDIIRNALAGIAVTEGA